MAAKGCRRLPLFDIPRQQTAFRVPPIATGPISSAASGCRSPSHCHRSTFLSCLPTGWVGGAGSPDLFEPLSCLRRSPRARRRGPTPPAAIPNSLPSPVQGRMEGSSASAVSRTRHGDASGDPARAWGADGTLGEAGTHGARMVRLGTPVPTWVGATPGAGCLGIPKRERISGGARLGIPGRERILGVPNGARPGRIKHLVSKPVHAPALLSTRCAKPARVPGGLSTGAPSRARTPKGLGTPHQLRPWAPVLGRLRRPTGGATPVAKHREPEAIRGQARLGIPPLPLVRMPSSQHPARLMHRTHDPAVPAGTVDFRRRLMSVCNA